MRDPGTLGKVLLTSQTGYLKFRERESFEARENFKVQNTPVTFPSFPAVLRVPGTLGKVLLTP
jgi:hypothetical protein